MNFQNYAFQVPDQLSTYGSTFLWREESRIFDVTLVPSAPCISGDVFLGNSWTALQILAL